MRRFTLSLITLLLCCISMIAQQRSESEAIQIAQEFFGKKGLTPKLSVVSHQKVEAQVRKRVAAARKAPAKSQSFYVVNDEANNRFVIVSADERLVTILGYSDNGIFNENQTPDGLLDMLEGYNRQYDYLMSLDDVKESRRPYLAPSIVIEPLIKSEWGQDSPFNDQCPLNPRYAVDTICASGCVATAMAQVMNFYKYPTNGNGYYSYNSATLKIFQSFDFGSLNMNWSNILDKYTADATDAQKAEVAKLMHACGVSVSMNYGTQGNESGAYDWDIPYAMIKHFGYNANITYKSRDYYSNEDWNELILAELEAGRPILYSGSGSGGHEFILDGCNAEGLYHFNFGWVLDFYGIPWTGIGNGYYSIDAIKPKFLGEEIGNYTKEQAMVCNIAPNLTGIHEDVFYSTSFSIYGTSLRPGSKATVSCYPRCFSSDATYAGHTEAKFKGTVGVGLFDLKFNLIKPLYSESVSLNSRGSSFIYDDITFDTSTFTEGKQFFIAPYAQSNSSQKPTLIRTANGDEDYYLAQVKDGKIILTVKGELPDIHEVVVGTYNVSAASSNGGVEEWQVTLFKDGTDDTMYWIKDIDPAVAKKGFTYSKGWNKIHGTVNETRTQLIVPTGQVVGDNITITNYSSADDIIVYLSDADSTMTIKGAWGAVERGQSGDNASQTDVSRYNSTDFAYTTVIIEEDITMPVIAISANSIMTLSCVTEGAELYFTLDGSTPLETPSMRYSEGVKLEENCIIKAIAVKDGKKSDVAIYEVRTFVVSVPYISASGNTISISCSNSSTIYYTLDGTTPSTTSILYNGSFECTTSTVIKAFAVRKNYLDSEVSTYIHHPIDPVIDDLHIAVTNTVAGQLSSQIPSDKKLSITGLTVTGVINGTDIKYIREMIVDGKLTDLNIAGSNIVSGGESYYSSYTEDYVTTDNLIGPYMFYNCKGLISLLLPTTATKIDMNAIYGCENLVEITLPDASKEIGMFGIYNCKNLKKVTMSSKTEIVDETNYNFCPALIEFVVPEGNDAFVAKDGVLFTKDEQTLVKYPQGKTALSYSIPTTVKTIGQYAFNRSQLKNIEMPNSVTTIETGAFEYSKNMENIVIPNSVTEIKMMAFSNCSALKSIVLSDKLKEIETLAFSYCVSLQTINIPKSVKEFDGTAFNGCSSLLSFTVAPENAWFTAIDGVLYSKNLRKLIKCPMAMYATRYQIVEGVEEICDYAFYKCQNISEFYLPESVRTIGTSAFEYCTMSNIRIPESVSSIGMMAFANCDNLESFTIPSGVEELELMILAYCDKLSYLYIPSGIKTIELSTFSNCKMLNMIGCAINDPSLVELPESYGGGYDQFKAIPDTCTWRIPIGTTDKYKAQPWWVNTWRIIEDPNIDHGVGIDAIDADKVTIAYHNGELVVNSSEDGIIRIYSINGSLLVSNKVRCRESYRIRLPQGLYIINNKKMLLK